LEQGDASVAIAVDLDEGLGGALVAGGMKDHLGGKSEVDDGGKGPGLGSDLVPQVGVVIRSGRGALRGQQGGQMACLVEEVAGVEQTLRVDDEAAWLQRDAG
jgi:hypothetical protein